MNSKLRIVTGIFIIAIGIAFMLDILEVIDAGSIFSIYWPVILIVVGIATLIDRSSSSFFGIILILIGIYFQLNQLDLDILNHVDLSELIWPIIIIVIGIRIFMTKRK